MALFTGDSVDDVYKKLRGRWREIRQASVNLRANAAAGPVSFTDVRNYYERIFSELAGCETLVTKFDAATLQDYARAQQANPTYNPAAEYGAMRAATNAVLTHIATALPANSAHTVSNGRVTEPSFSTVQTATLRGLLDTLIGTLGAP